MQVLSLNNIKGTPIGVANLAPPGDRGPTYGKSKNTGILLPGKIAGFWAAPYDGRITAVYMSIDRGGARIVFLRKRSNRSGVPGVEDMINRHGYTIKAPISSGAHKTFTNLSDFLDINVFKGDIFTVAIVELFNPKPTDVAGNLLVIQTDGSLPEGVEQLKLS